MSDSHSISSEQEFLSELMKCTSTFIANEDEEPPFLVDFFQDYPSMSELCKKTMELIQSITKDENVLDQIDLALRILTYETHVITQSNAHTEISMTNIKSLTSLRNFEGVPSSPRGIQIHENQEMELLSIDLKNAKKKIDDLMTESKEQKKENKELLAQIENIKEEAAKVSEQFEKDKVQFATEIENLKDNIEQLNEELSYAKLENNRKNAFIKKENEEHEKTIAEMETTIAELVKKKKELRTEIKKLKKELLTKNDKEDNLDNLDNFLKKYVQNEKMLDEMLNDNERLGKLVNIINHLFQYNDAVFNMLSDAEKQNKEKDDQIYDLEDEIEQLKSDYSSKQNSVNSLNDEIKTLQEKIAEMGEENEKLKETANEKVILQKDDIEKKTAVPAPQIPQTNPIDEEYLHKLECAIGSLARYLIQLLNGDGEALPLIFQSGPLLEDINVRDSAIECINDLVSQIDILSSSENNQDNSLLEKLFSSPESTEKIVEELVKKDTVPEYLAVVALSQANSNMKNELTKIIQQLTYFQSLLPNDYRNNDNILKSIQDYLLNTQVIFHSIFDCITTSKYFHSRENSFMPLILEFISKVKKLVQAMDNELRPQLGNGGDLHELPSEAANLIEQMKSSIGEMKDTINDLNSKLEAPIPNLDNLNSFINTPASSNSQLENNTSLPSFETEHSETTTIYQTQLIKLGNKNKKLKFAIDDLEKQHQLSENKIKILQSQRDEYKALAEKRKERFAKRKEFIIRSEQNIAKENLDNEKKRYKKVIKELKEDIGRKNEKIKKLKEENEAEKKEIEKKNVEDNEKLKKELQEKEENHKKEIESLIAMTRNRHKDAIEKTISGLSTPTKVSSNDSIVNSSSFSGVSTPGRTPDIDRFITQIGRVLSKYTSNGIPTQEIWTRTKILSTISTLVARVDEIESSKQDLTIRSYSNLTPATAKLNGGYKENRSWQQWATNLAINANITFSSSDELKTSISDIVYATTAKSTLLRIIQSLRAQKKILLLNQGLYKVFEKAKSDGQVKISFVNLISVVRCSKALYKFSLKKTLNSSTRNLISSKNNLNAVRSPIKA